MSQKLNTPKGTRDFSSLELKKREYLDLQPKYLESNFLNGFGHKDKKFHFSPIWKKNDKKFNNFFI